jgi:subtilisin
MSPLAAPAQGFLRTLSQIAPPPGTHPRAVKPRALPALPEAPAVKIKVLDSIADDGAKLIEIDPDSLPALRALQPGLRFAPVRYYRRLAERDAMRSRLKAAAAGTVREVTFRVVSAADQGPVRGATVVAFTDFEAREGAQGTTGAQGQLKLTLRAARIQRLFVYPDRGYWSGYRKNLAASGTIQVSLHPLDLTFTDALRHFYGQAPPATGQGVRVGVVDTGVGPHPDLGVAGGRNTVQGEDPGDFSDGDIHGTHVAGIIAAHGTPPTGVRGMAPGAQIFAYRVFGKNKDTASNYDIAKALDAARQDQCDVVNMSLGLQVPADGSLHASDEALRAAIEDAHEGGVLSVAAAGNDDRGPVNFPALDELCIAVSAMGRKGTYPTDTTESADVAAPFGKDHKNFIAAFSNIGPEIDLTAPGVGILSTVPGGHAPLSGTSMSTPVVAGFAARILAARPDLRAMARDAARPTALAQALAAAARSLGFKPTYEGRGMPQ